MSEAASIWLAKRSVTPLSTIRAAIPQGAGAEASADTPEDAITAAPAAVAEPAAAGTVTVAPIRTLPADPPMNRRDRRARESLARRSAHRKAQGAGLAASVR
jgi:hypothetical protein